MQNIRVEIVDMLHFLVSLALTAGLTAEEFHRLYMAKHEVNQKRQETGYSRENKNEDENRRIV
jgi:dimeric dUTPase (all-alpha-NTP-PPase superfamily)